MALTKEEQKLRVRATADLTHFEQLPDPSPLKLAHAREQLKLLGTVEGQRITIEELREGEEKLKQECLQMQGWLYERDATVDRLREEVREHQERWQKWCDGLSVELTMKSMLSELKAAHSERDVLREEVERLKVAGLLRQGKAKGQKDEIDWQREEIRRLRVLKDHS